MAQYESYLAAGTNRHPAVADWGESGILAFGCDRNIGLWQPNNPEFKGAHDILSGHTDTVNAVRFLPGSEGTILSGSVDKTVKIWKRDGSSGRYLCSQTLTDHASSVNCIAVVAGAKLFATGSADAIIKIWSLDDQDTASLQQTITIAPRFFPLTLALRRLNETKNSYILAAAGTKDIIQLYILDADKGSEFTHEATLSGHEGWIRSLEFTQEISDPSSDLLLSSASQDKYIRLWRIHLGLTLPTASTTADPTLGAYLPGKSLSNKAHRFSAEGSSFSATFEALLLGHEDWIYSTRWSSAGERLQLLSASADNSLAIWEADAETGVWVTVARLGEISAEKGSTTATGSTGGFWTGLWSPNGKTVTCLGRTGSWRLWTLDAEKNRWLQKIGISGHTQSITGIAWSKDGNYLLSTSSDQTTRLHAKWKRENQSSWHEMARPQIHGYDLNCIDSLGASQFVSGADEKLLRVFNEPKAVANLLHSLCGFSSSQMENMPDAANMPVLGLSNKAIEAVEDDVEIAAGDHKDREAIDPASVVHKSTLNLDHPPFEEHLSRHTLWPEIEKLYGHGYEISALAASHDGSVIATACKASSIDHAVIRLFETSTWHEIKPPLTAHSLTVTSLAFSPDDRFLLSVGRDRQWAVYERGEKSSSTYKLKTSNPKGHTRMILDAAWAPTDIPIFATAGRDKQVKIWSETEDSSFELKITIPEDSAVTAIDFLNKSFGASQTYLAVGTETGLFKIYSLETKVAFTTTLIELDNSLSFPYPSKAITQLAWKPSQRDEPLESKYELAIASEDSSLRVYPFTTHLS